MRRADCRPRRERQDTISTLAKRRTSRDSRSERRAGKTKSRPSRENVINEKVIGKRNFCGLSAVSQSRGAIRHTAVGESNDSNFLISQFLQNMGDQKNYNACVYVRFAKVIC